MSIKRKTIDGFYWSALDNIVGRGIAFIIGIILARLLSPKEFGLVGMTSIFIAISETFINSGFINALIRKNKATQLDYSTVFYFNLAVGILFSLLLFFFAPAISRFFNEPALTLIIRFLGFGLIIEALTVIQRTILTKRIDFKLLTKTSLASAVISGFIAIYMAYTGFGVWSLIAQMLIKQAVNSALLWYWNKWKPDFAFSISSFRELFGFGSKLLLVGLIDTLYNHINLLVIGKYFSARDLGLYTRADQFVAFPSKNLNTVVSRVSLPVLSSLQDDKEKLRVNYTKLIRSTMFLTFVLMFGLAATSESFVMFLIGDQWKDSIVYIKLLSVIGVMYPLHALNLNILQISGRSDIFLMLEIVKKLLSIPTILIGIKFGIIAMLIAMIFHNLIAFVLNSHYCGKILHYGTLQQLVDITPSFLLASAMFIIVILAGFSLSLSYYSLIFFIQLIIGLAFVILVGELMKLSDYIYLKRIIIEKIQEKRK